MKNLMLVASALSLIAAPAHAQLLGSGQAGTTGSLNGTINSTVCAPTDTVRSTTRGTVRGDAATRGSQDVDREKGSVAIDRSVDASVGAATNQTLDTRAGQASGNGSSSGNASGSGSANAQLIGTDAVTGAVRNTAATARDRLSGAAGQAGSVAGSISGTVHGPGMIDSGVLALAGRGPARGEGAYVVTPGMPVELSSGHQLGTVREIVATRSGEVRHLLVETKNGLTTIPANRLTSSGSVLIAAEATSEASAEQGPSN